MKILVTGGAGFIGSHVAETLIAAGHDVLVVDDLSSGHERNLVAGVAFEKQDIRSAGFETLMKKFRPQAVAHLAAQIDVRRSVADPVLDCDINVLGTVRVAHAAAQVGCQKLIFASTGGAIYGEQDEFPATEDHPCRPVSPYGTSKLCAENYLAYFERAGGPKAICLRYANVYGPRQDPHGEAGVVAIFARRMLAGQAPIVNGDGKQTRDYVFVKDVAEANLRSLELSHGGVFNIGTAIENDVNCLVDMLAELIPSGQRAVHAEAKAGEQRRSCITPALAEKEMGFEPKVDLKTGMQETVLYFGNNPE